jgi:4-aminobutyrate aminotransferase-like enzyme
MTMAVGPLSLGYADPVIDEAIRTQLADGITFSLMHPLEVEVAELVRDVVPHAESVRYSKTGCDATTAAVRVARAFTGREKVLCCGYHGWHDWYIAVTDRNRGIPASTQDLTFTFQYNDVKSVEDARRQYRVRDLSYRVASAAAGLEGSCAGHERGALLVFDEGGRVPAGLGGAQPTTTRGLACFSRRSQRHAASALTGRPR